MASVCHDLVSFPATSAWRQRRRYSPKPPRNVWSEPVRGCAQSRVHCRLHALISRSTPRPPQAPPSLVRTLASRPHLSACCVDNGEVSDLRLVHATPKLLFWGRPRMLLCTGTHRSGVVNEARARFSTKTRGQQPNEGERMVVVG